MTQNLTKKQALVITGFTGILCCQFSLFHEDVEKRLGRSVWTHEFGSKEFSAELKDVYREDFMAMLYKGE